MDGDGDRAPLGERVDGVEQQVGRDLLELAFVTDHPHRLRIELGDHPDRAPGEAFAQQIEALLGEPAQIELPALVRALPGEVEQPVDDVRGAEGLPLDLLEQGVARIVLGGVGEQHLGVARDAGQRRVHLVRHAGGEQAERGEPILLLECLFEPGPLGQILHHEDPAPRLRSPAQRGHTDLELAFVIVAAAPGHDRRRGPGQRQLADRQQGRERPPRQALAPHAEELGDGEVGLADDARLVEHGDPRGRGLDDPFVAPLQVGDLLELALHLLEEAGVLDGERRLVEQRAGDLEVLAVERFAVRLRAGEQETDRAPPHRSGKA